MEIEKKFQGKLENVPVIAGFMGHSMEKYWIDFTALSPLFNDDYKKRYFGLQKEAEELVNTKILTGQLKDVTNQLYENMEEMRPMLNRLETYVDLCNGHLSPSKESFGIKAVRDEIQDGDAEGLYYTTKMLEKNITHNFKLLNSVGLTQAAFDELTHKAEETKKNNSLQDQLMKERKGQGVENYDVLNNLWEMIQTVAKVGKVLYKYEHPERLDDFTISKIEQRINHKNEKNEAEA